MILKPHAGHAEGEHVGMMHGGHLYELLEATIQCLGKLGISFIFSGDVCLPHRPPHRSNPDPGKQLQQGSQRLQSADVLHQDILFMHHSQDHCTFERTLDWRHAGQQVRLSTTENDWRVQVQARIFGQTPATMRQVLAPKAAALQSLQDSCWPAPTAFDILFSSVSSIAGTLGHTTSVS